MQQRWPEQLWIVRHGESAGNIARDAANAAGLPRIDIAERDADVPLSSLGGKQADALGRWFAVKPEGERPDAVLTSPYLRARQTAERVCAAAEVNVASSAFVVDERLREKELGILDRLTRAGVLELEPDQAEFRRALGKFYHRPPGGESWCDVILRLRSALDTMSLHYSGRRVLLVAHQVIVLCLRYLLENLDEQRLLAIDAAGDVANCSVTEYRFSADDRPSGGMRLLQYNFVAPLEREGTPVTSERDANVVPR